MKFSFQQKKIVICFISQAKTCPLLCLYIEEELKMYNNGKKYEKWKKKKDKEDEKLRQCGFSEEKIALLRAYDEQAFRLERKYKSHENVTKEALFAMTATYDVIEILSVESLLDSLEDKHLIFVLNSSDRVTLDIAFLLFMGYKVKDISKVLHLSKNAVRKRIYVLRNRIGKI